MNNPEKAADMGYFGCCPVCGKRRYISRKAAKNAMRRVRGRGVPGRLAVYRCGEWFHIGHQPGIITRGEVDRAEFDGSRRRPRGGKYDAPNRKR